MKRSLQNRRAFLGYGKIQFNMGEAESRAPLDQLWYERFKPTGSFQAYEYLDGDKQTRDREKQRFLGGEIENPTLDYPRLDSQELTKIEQQLLSLKKDLVVGESDPTVRQLYRWKLNEKIAEVRLLQAAKTEDMRRFRRYSQFIYGDPQPEIFNYTVNRIRNQARRSLQTTDSPLRQAATALLEILPGGKPAAAGYDLPAPDTVSSARSQTLVEMSALINIPDTQEMLTAAEIKTAFDRALEILGGQGWQVVVDQSSKTGVSVDQESQQVKVPQSRRVSREKLQGLIVHEIGTHVARRQNGQRSRLMLLGLGLDRYEQGEEGVATMREQAIRGAVEEFSGLDRHFAIGLATGIDGQPRNFRQVFDIIQKLSEFENLSAGKSQPEAASAGRDRAWNTCVRVFRGTDCRTPGVCFTKDIVYAQGNIDVWNVVRENPAEMIRFNLGKYDPANARHLWILDRLGITEEDLQKLKE